MSQPCWPVKCNPASFEECALRPTAGIWLVLEHALETAEVRGLVHDHLMFLSFGVLPGRASSVERPKMENNVNMVNGMAGG